MITFNAASLLCGLGSFVFLSLFHVIAVDGNDARTPNDVTLTVTADREQPTGWPIVVEVTLTNTGQAPLGWWCGGPGRYPGAEHFVVRVRYGADDNWHSVNATNGQYVQGSGLDYQLKTGESIVIPLALPEVQAGPIHYRVEPRIWRAAAPAEGYAATSDQREHIDKRRVQVIQAVVAHAPPFWQHVAERYPDSVILDGMLKLVTLDNVPIAGGAARVLARQETLPAAAGETFAILVERWLPRSPSPAWGGLQEYVVEAALKTQSEPARAAVIKQMHSSNDATTRWIAMNALRLSPGDLTWLRRARNEIAALRRSRGDDGPELVRQTTLATDWLDSRIKNSGG